MKLQEQMLKKICEKWQLTITEGKRPLFLYNNPQKTLLPTLQSSVCFPKKMFQAVENLIQKGFLKRTVDEMDRRKIHLSLLVKDDITKSISSMQKQLYHQIFNGLKKDLKFYGQINEQ